MKKISLANALRFSIQSLRRDFFYFLSLVLVAFGVSLVPRVGEWLSAGHAFLFVAWALIDIVVAVLIPLGLVRMYLRYYEGIKISYQDLFTTTKYFWRYLAVGVIYGFISLPFILGGFWLVVSLFSFATPVSDTFLSLLATWLRTIAYTPLRSVVVIVLMMASIVYLVRTSLCYFVLVDENCGPFTALKKSFAYTRGALFPLLLIMLIFILINVAGTAVFFVGSFITIPLTQLAFVYIYHSLKKGAA